nr:transposase, mutator type [Tanacetum cinerariifolium]
AFLTVFCLKINHSGAFTPPPKIRYKGGKVNWVDTIDSDVFYVVEVNNMMKELGYEKPSFDYYYYKEPKNDLDNGLKKLSSNQDVLQMLNYVEKYKVIDLYVDHYVTKETVNVDESLLVNELDNDLVIGNEMLRENDKEDMIEDVSEDEWLQKSLRLVGIKKKHAVENDNVRGQSARNESMNVEDDRDDGSNSDDGSASDDDSDSQDNDFLVDPDNMIDDIDVDMAKFRSNIDANVEWVGSKAIVTMEEEFEEEEVNHDKLDSGSDSEYEGERKKALKMYHKMNKANTSNAESGGTTWKENFYVGLKFSNSKEIEEMVTRVAVKHRRELHLKKNDRVRVRCIYKGKVPQFGCEDEDDDSSSKGVVSSGSIGKGQSKKKGQVSGSKGKSNNKTKAGGGRAHYDVLLNIMCEVFNRHLIDEKDKPIITCLVFIREYLMKRIINVQKVISKSDGPFTPNATKVFNKIMKEARQIKIDWNDGDLYQATTPWGDQCVVNIRTKECGCRKWELTGIPCKHALATIWDMAGNGEENAIPESYGHQATQKRKKSAAELAEGMVKGNKLSKAGRSITCGKCKGIGHNQRKCPNDASA